MTAVRPVAARPAVNDNQSRPARLWLVTVIAAIAWANVAGAFVAVWLDDMPSLGRFAIGACIGAVVLAAAKAFDKANGHD